MCHPAALNPGGCTGPCSHKALMEPAFLQLKKKSEVIGEFSMALAREKFS